MSTAYPTLHACSTIFGFSNRIRTGNIIRAHCRAGIRILLTTTVLMALMPSTSSVMAINIVLNFDAAQSDSPTFDPTGALLQPLFQHAETVYQNAFQDNAANTTLTINFWYEDLSGSNLGAHNLVTQTTSGGTQPNREIVANIRIDTLTGTPATERNWFIDTTPEDDEEFAMQQTLWRDLTDAQKTDLFNAGADIPDTFETAYSGSAVAGGPAVGSTDMLTVILHEVGHALGMSSSNNATVAETTDNDYDFDPDFVFGKTLAAEIADGGNIAHLDTSGNFLMDPGIGTSLRRRPSHSDLFSMAAGHSYTSLDVPRREFYRPGGGGNWNNPANWSGNEVPESGDDVYVRDNRPDATDSLPTANLTANGAAANLTVAEGADFDTEEFRLDVGGTITVTDTNSDLYIRDGGEAEAETLIVTNDAELRPKTGGLIDVDELTLDGTLLSGAGTVDVQDELLNNGTITANDGVLTLQTSNPDGVFNLDGYETSGTGISISPSSEPGVVNATGGDIIINGQLFDAFNGTLNVSADRTITFNEDWELGGNILYPILPGIDGFIPIPFSSDGVVNLTEGTIDGTGTMLAQGTVNVSADAGDGVSYINSPVEFTSAVDVNVNAGAQLEINGAATVSGGKYDVDDDGLLDFDGTLSIGNATFNDVGTAGTADVRFDGITTYTGGTIESSVTITQKGEATVNGATVINGNAINLDGNGTTTITLNDTLTINADSLETSNDKTFNGTLNINNPGYLTVSTTDGFWTMGGEMHLDQNGAAARYLVRGDDINITGEVTVTGATAISATAHISGTVSLGEADDLFQLGGGDNTLSGGEIVGPGRLVAVGTDWNNSLTGYGTISTDIEFSSTNTNLLADGGTLSVSGDILDVDSIGTNSTTGTLDMANAWNTGTANELRLNGGIVTGSGITNDGTTIGHGLITSSSFVNNSVLTAEGGTLTFDTGSAPDLDGITETGVINALLGSVEVLNSHSSSFSFDGTINVGAGQSFRSDFRGLANSGVINMTNGTVSASGLRHQEQLNVFAGGTSRLEAPTIDFQLGSTSTIDDDLELAGVTDIFAGAVFAGSGRLVVTPGSQLHLLDGATVDITIENNGELEVGSSPGAATIDNFTQTAGGQWQVELSGTVPGTEYDQLNVINDANLDGLMSIQDLAPYADPSVRGTLDEFTLITAGNINGTFAAVEYDGIPLSPTFSEENGSFRSHQGNGLFRNIAYDANSVELVNLNALEGDADGDVDVDITDFNIWSFYFDETGVNSSTNNWTTADFDSDGDVDITDFNFLAGNFSELGYASFSGDASQVPEPNTLILIACGVLASILLIRRR